ncbi:hypothetical protein [Macrococcoides canis]|uniref:hypothetical protein n=1 Tax=Macrococcoides canis TaxID=1855823 RepID=UPI0014096E3D|nr:hypothetical protein [Macrococcus canis]
MEIFTEFYMHYGLPGKKYKYVKATYERIGLTSSEKTEMIEDIKNKSNEVLLALNKSVKEYQEIYLKDI